MSINFYPSLETDSKQSVCYPSLVYLYTLYYTSIITTDFDVSDYGDKFIPSIIFDDNNDNGENLKDPQPELITIKEMAKLTLQLQIP